MGLQPRGVMATLHVVDGGDEEGGKGVRGFLREIAIARASRRSACPTKPARASGAPCPGPGGPRQAAGSAERYVGVLVIAEAAGVAVRVVGEHAPVWVQLEDIEPVAPETVVAVDRRPMPATAGQMLADLPVVIDPGIGLVGSRKGDLHPAGARCIPEASDWPSRPLAASGAFRTPAGGGRREADVALVIEEAEERRIAAVGIEGEGEGLRPSTPDHCDVALT